MTTYNKEIVKKSDRVLSPLHSLFDFWPTRWNGNFDDFDFPSVIKPFVPISVGGDEENITVDVEVPGFAKEDIKITIDKKTLFIDCKNAKKSAYFSSTVPNGVVADPVDAKLENGILQITFKRSEESKPKTIKIS